MAAIVRNGRFWNAGYRFALRYVGRTQMASHDLTAADWAAYNVDGVSDPRPRSWQLVQLVGGGTVGGLSTEVYDADETRTDGKGGTAVWLQR
jgi:hypothetical protein